MAELLDFISDDLIKKWQLSDDQLNQLCNIIKEDDYQALINFLSTNNLGMLTKFIIEHEKEIRMERNAETVGNLQGLIDKKRELELEIQKIDHQLEENGVTDILDKVPEPPNVTMIKGYFAKRWFGADIQK